MGPYLKTNTSKTQVDRGISDWRITSPDDRPSAGSELFARFGYPKYIISDNGSQFYEHFDDGERVK